VGQIQNSFLANFTFLFHTFLKPSSFWNGHIQTRHRKKIKSHLQNVSVTSQFWGKRSDPVCVVEPTYTQRHQLLPSTHVTQRSCGSQNTRVTRRMPYLHIYFNKIEWTSLCFEMERRGNCGWVNWNCSVLARLLTNTRKLLNQKSCIAIINKNLWHTFQGNRSGLLYSFVCQAPGQ
jgi:hypothetical protein